ncbi:hypothetical protein ACJMK2_018144 [Sinanodonta woodiana]|uniref:Fibrinogen C-terminal domain-containing protein n=1 Tax=Sinanodonta woodiana TaxID=1069815 RepID=A0ABD3UG51_SINWO
MGMFSAVSLVLIISFTINLCVVTSSESYFCENVKCSSLENLICTNYILWTLTGTRKSQCFLKYVHENDRCQSVFYKDRIMKCQGHSSVLTSQDNCIVEEGTMYYHKCTARRPRNCQEILCAGQTSSGIFKIYPDQNSNGVSVRCDMDTDGGGWTVFQRRVDGSIDFYRKWDEYKSGFGNAETEYWLGLNTIQKLTAQGNKTLRVDLITPGPPQRSAYATYSSFTVGNETSNYLLRAVGYSGHAGDSMNYHSNMKFSTQDRDNDQNNASCAIKFHGAWWYISCHTSHLNGIYGTKIYGEGINWKTLSGLNVSMTYTEMKMK